jgi:hypothetical protein
MRDHVRIRLQIVINLSYVARSNLENLLPNMISTFFLKRQAKKDEYEPSWMELSHYREIEN